MFWDAHYSIFSVACHEEIVYSHSVLYEKKENSKLWDVHKECKLFGHLLVKFEVIFAEFTLLVKPLMIFKRIAITEFFRLKYE